MLNFIPQQRDTTRRNSFKIKNLETVLFPHSGDHPPKIEPKKTLL